MLLLRWSAFWLLLYWIHSMSELVHTSDASVERLERFTADELEAYRSMTDYFVAIMLATSRVSPINYFLKFRGQSQASHYRLQTIANEMLQRIEQVPVHIGEANYIRKATTFHVNFLLVDTVETFAELVKHITNKMMVERTLQYLIAYVPIKLSVAPPLAAMSAIFKLLLSRQILNADIAVPFPNDIVRIYTYFPHSPGDCSSTRPVLLHVHSGRKAVLTDFRRTLYPPKYVNFHGCPLRVVTANEPPFVVLHPERPGYEAISGIEGELFKAIAINANFTLDLVDMGSDFGGTVYPNGTATGAFKILHERGANITFGDFACYPHRMMLLTASDTHYQSYVNIVANLGATYTSLEVLFYPIKRSGWYATIGILAVRWALKLLAPRLPAVSCTFKRFMIAMWLIIVFFYRIGYESFYFNYLSSRPLKPVPSSYSEFREQGYTLIVDFVSASFMYIIEDARDFHVKYEMEPDETYALLQCNKLRKLGALTKQEYLAYYLQKRPNMAPSLYMAPENVVVDMLCFYFTRPSFLVVPFNRRLRHLQSFGIVNKLRNDFIDLHTLARARMVGNLNTRSVWPDPNLNELTMSQMKSVFGMLIAVWIVASLLFVVECLSLKLGWLKRLLDGWHTKLS